MKIDICKKAAFTFIFLVILAGSWLGAGFLSSTAHARAGGVADANRISNAATALNILKVAVVDHYAKFGSFPIGDNTFELTLQQEGLLAKPFSLMSRDGNSGADSHIRVNHALRSTLLVTATNAAFNFEGGLTNQATGSVVIETVIFNVSSQDARELSLRVDGPKLTGALGEADLRGRLKFGAIPANGFGEVHVYFTHR